MLSDINCIFWPYFWWWCGGPFNPAPQLGLWTIRWCKTWSIIILCVSLMTPNNIPHLHKSHAHSGESIETVVNPNAHTLNWIGSNNKISKDFIEFMRATGKKNRCPSNSPWRVRQLGNFMRCFLLPIKIQFENIKTIDWIIAICKCWLLLRLPSVKYYWYNFFPSWATLMDVVIILLLWFLLLPLVLLQKKINAHFTLYDAERKRKKHILKKVNCIPKGPNKMCVPWFSH